MARETINGISVPIPGTGEPPDFVADLRRIATDLWASTAASIADEASEVRGALREAGVQEVESDARRWGAFGDGTSHLLSTMYATLAEAQVDYPAAEALTDEADWAAIQSAINATGRCSLTPGLLTYYVNKPITLTHAQSIGGAPGERPRLYMTANNTPIITCNPGGVTGAGVSVERIRLTYNRQQTSAETDSDAIRLYNVLNGSAFRDIRIDYAARGIYNAGGGYTYSSVFENISIGYYSITAFDLRNGGGITGNVVSNLYTHNNATGTPVSSTEAPVQIGGWDDGILSQINVEHTKANSAILITNCRNLTIDGLHIEGFHTLGDYTGLVNCAGANTQVNISGLSIVFCSFLSENITLSNVTGIFKVVGGVMVHARSIQDRNNTVTASGLGMVFCDSSVTDANMAQVSVFDAKLTSFGGNALGVTTKVSVVRSFNGRRNWDLLGDRYETAGTAAPTSGTWAVGDRRWNTAPAASGFMGWVCVTAGTPGTWKTFGAISA